MFQARRKIGLAALISLAAVVSSGNAQAAGKGNFSTNQICKAGIATVMGRDPAIIRIDRVQGEVVYLSYIRKDDGKKWGYKCTLDGNRIVWGSDTGRWRTHKMDSKVFFYVEGSVLKVEDRFSDGSATQKSFNSKQLGK